MKSPVSVIVPTYNRATLITQTLDSILSQRLPPTEVIVVDDGSTDNTREVVDRFGDAVRYLAVKNGGESWARNCGVEISSQPFVAFCDSDDLWHEDKLATQMGLHQSRPDLPYSFTNFRTLRGAELSPGTKFDDAPPSFQKISNSTDATTVVSEEPLYKQVLEFQPIFPSSIVISRERFEAIGRCCAELGRTLSVDLEFCLRCVQQGPIGICKDPLTIIRKHDSNFSGDTLKTDIGEIEILRYVAKHHTLDQDNLQAVLTQIDKRQPQILYGLFKAGRFAEYLQLIAAVPPQYVDTKARLKQLICHLPRPVATLLQRTLVS